MSKCNFLLISLKLPICIQITVLTISYKIERFNTIIFSVLKDKMYLKLPLEEKECWDSKKKHSVHSTDTDVLRQ